MSIYAIKEKAENDRAFLTSLCESTSEDQIIRLCAENDLEITREEASDLLKGFETAKNMEQDEELSVEDLDNVAGGFVLDMGTAILIGAGLYLIYKGGKKVGQWMGKIKDKLFGK